ncbi:MAG: hypothetical protein JO113_08585, partial [Candidatus Eremiobacteraeota bacterium]|nr:hypothetical protein [Candidatus Eremiobacteraeota bacterium]
RALQSAKVVLVVIDGSVPLGSEARALLERTRGMERILFFNKADIARPEGGIEPNAIVGSVYDPASLERLTTAIARLGWGGERPDASRPHLAALYEFDAVNAAIDALGRACRTLRSREPLDFVTTDLQRGFSSLGHVTEQVAAEELIDGIFSRFCIGK